MRQTVKLIIKYILYGISEGCTFFVICCLLFSAGGREDISASIYNDFARQSAGAMLVGIACGTTAVVYQINGPSLLMKTIIHFCVGMGVFYPVAIYLGWIPWFPGQIVYTVLQFTVSCCIFMAIWFVFYLLNRKEAKKINERLRELERSNVHKE